MADAVYDAVIIGGGTKSMVTAIYLAKYGGMSVGVFEERRELCGGLTSEQSVVPGFIADYHASSMAQWYFAPVKDDFPDFEEKGGKIVHCPSPWGVISKNDQSCWTIYNLEIDPNQEKTAKELARFSSERDAELYLKLWETVKPGSDFDVALMQDLFNISPRLGDPTPSPLEKWFNDFMSDPHCPFDPSWAVSSAVDVIPTLWDRPALSVLYIRLLRIIGLEPARCPGILLLAFLTTGPTTGFILGGTHNVAHAYQRILHENGGKWFARQQVDKILIENGQAKGIQLADGSQIEAKKVVVSGIDPYQLVVKLIGKDYINPRDLIRVENLKGDATGIAWFTWFLHDLPKYKAAAFNPDIAECGSIALVSDNLNHIRNDLNWRLLGKIPPIQDSLVFQNHSIIDKTRAPEGKHTVLQDREIPGVTALSEREWLEFKKTGAQETMDEWQEYAENMSWDNVIGYAPQTPYDAAGRNLSFSRTGNPGQIDDLPGQTGRFAPLPEMAQHRMPIKNLYATGTWRRPGGASCNQGYVCYKAIAEDLGLSKPWEEKGRPY